MLIYKQSTNILANDSISIFNSSKRTQRTVYDNSTEFVSLSLAKILSLIYYSWGYENEYSYDNKIISDIHTIVVTNFRLLYNFFSNSIK